MSFDVLPKDIIRLLLLKYIEYKDIGHIWLTSKMFHVLTPYQLLDLRKKYYANNWYDNYLKRKQNGNKLIYTSRTGKAVRRLNKQDYKQCPKCANVFNITTPKRLQKFNNHIHKHNSNPDFMAIPTELIHGIYVICDINLTICFGCEVKRKVTKFTNIEPHKCPLLEKFHKSTHDRLTISFKSPYNNELKLSAQCRKCHTEFSSTAYYYSSGGVDYFYRHFIAHEDHCEDITRIEKKFPGSWGRSQLKMMKHLVLANLKNLINKCDKCDKVFKFDTKNNTTELTFYDILSFYENFNDHWDYCCTDTIE